MHLRHSTWQNRWQQFTANYEIYKIKPPTPFSFSVFVFENATSKFSWPRHNSTSPKNVGVIYLPRLAEPRVFRHICPSLTRAASFTAFVKIRDALKYLFFFFFLNQHLRLRLKYVSVLAKICQRQQNAFRKGGGGEGGQTRKTVLTIYPRVY